MTTERTIHNLHDAFRAYGYIVMADPIPGLESAYIASLREGIAKIESAMICNARRYGYRGRSRAALSALHTDLPEPVWGVKVAG